MNTLELRDAISQYVKECRSIVEICKQEQREMTDEEKTKFEELKSDIATKKEELKALEEKLAKYEEEMPQEPEKKECGDEDKNKRNKSNKMEKNFSLLRAIRSIAFNQPMDEIDKAVINTAAEEMRHANLNYSGQIQIPTEKRAAVTVAAEGVDVVATDIYNILEPLRAKNILVQAGAKFMTGLVGDVQVPIMTAANVTWEGETASAKDGAGTFSNVKLSPKRLTAYIDISKQFLAQDGLGAEALIRQDLINAINSKLEATILGAGAGSGTEPKGIFNEAEADTITNFASLTALEAKLEDANVYGETKYIMAPNVKAALRNLPKSAKTTQLVMENNAVDGTPALVTSNVAKNMLAYGDFSNIAIGSWGAIDLTVDPYTKAGDGQVRLVINAFFDAKVLRPEAIVFGKTGA